MVEYYPNDQLLLVYKREKTGSIDIEQGAFIKEVDGWIYLDRDRKFNKNKVKDLRNLTLERKPPKIEDE